MSDAIIIFVLPLILVSVAIIGAGIVNEVLERKRYQRIGRKAAAEMRNLSRAYDRLEDGNRVTNTAEFHAYGRRWNVDTETMMDGARAKVERDAAARRASMARYRATFGRH